MTHRLHAPTPSVSFAPDVVSSGESFAPDVVSSGESFAPDVVSSGESFAPDVVSSGESFAPDVVSSGEETESMHALSIGPRRDRRRERGVAFLLVVTILVAMVLVALPFAMSMRQGEERTRTVGAQMRAQEEARLMADLVKLHLENTLPANERARFEQGERSVAADPNVDSLEELALDESFRQNIGRLIAESWTSSPEMTKRAEWLKSRGLDPLSDDRGTIASVEVQDAQARVNPTGASPFLLGNLFGLGLLSDDLDAGAGDISIEHPSGGRGGLPQAFAPDGGHIRIGRETIAYTSFDGTTFRGCTRGAIPKTPLGDNGAGEQHDRGTPVIDYTAWKLATHLIARRPGHLTEFRTLEELRDIASWGEGGVLAADRLERLLPYLTVWSRRESSSAWIADQLVVSALPSETSQEGGPEDVQLRDRVNQAGTTRYLNRGTIVKVTDGINTVYQTVVHTGDETGRQKENRVTLSGRVDAFDPEMEFEGGRAQLAAYAPYPININTAPVEVLYAVMANVHLDGADSPGKIVVPEVAWRLAERIVEARKGELQTDKGTGMRSSGPFRDAGDFGRFLAQLVAEGALGRDQRAALYMNAVNPHSSHLAFGTTLWCYRTLDVYHVESRVSVNNRSGEQVAESALREVVQVGPGSGSSWVLDSQSEFEERLAMGSGAKWVATFPYGVIWRDDNAQHVQPGLRGPKAWAWNVYPDSSRLENLGDVRLEPVRMQLPGAQFVDHFDSSYYTEGWFTGWQGAYTTKTIGSIVRSADAGPQPFTMSFWWRPYSTANWTAFDVGMDRFENRFACFVTDGQKGQELVFRACGATLEQRGAEVYVPLERLDYAPGNWYHIEVFALGEDPSSMRLLVDGIDVGIRRAFTYLTSGCSTDDTDLQVEGLEQFPTRGAIRVGREIVEYETLAGDSIRDCRRGMRGTLAEDWPAGMPVELLGYAMPLTVDILRGGSQLPTRLGQWSAMRVDSYQDTIVINEISLAGYAPDRTEVTFTAAPMWGQDEQTALDAFQEEGIAVLGSWTVSAPGGGAAGGGGVGGAGTVPVGGWEVVHYTRSGNEFTVERYIDTAWQGKADPYFLLTWHPGANQPLPAFILPISVHAGVGESAGTDDYFDPAKPEDREVLGRYYEGEEFTAYVLLGSNEPNGENEVIAYNSIDRERASNGFYFVRDRQIGGLTNHFFGESTDIAGGSASDGGTDDGADDGSSDDGSTDGSDGGPGPLPPGGVEPGGQDLPGLEGSDGDAGGGDGAAEPGTGDGTEGSPLDGDSAGAASEEPMDPSEGAGNSASGSAQGALPEGSGGSTGADDLPPPEEPPVDSTGGGDAENQFDDGDNPVPDADEAPGPQDPDDVPPAQDLPPVEHMFWTERAGPETARILGGMRGSLTREWIHNPTGDRNARFLPCFRVFEGVQGEVERAGAFDRITVHDAVVGSPTKTEAAIRWGHEQSGWCALEDFFPARVRAGETGANIRRRDVRDYPRILKFPSGELPEELPVEVEFARSSIGQSGVATGFLDELHVWRHITQWGGVVNNEEDLNAETDTITIVNPSGGTINSADLEGVDSRCGAVVLDGEIIVYRGLSFGGSEWTLERCERGQFGTRAGPHARGAMLHWLPDVFVSYLNGGLQPTGASIPLEFVENWPREGLVRIGRGESSELVHFTRRTEEGLLMPEALDIDDRSRGYGLMRGRFGTTPLSHESDAVVTYVPCRYWDRYAPRAEGDRTFEGVYDHPETSFLELGTAASDAWWNGFTWEENLTGGDESGQTDPRSARGSERGGYLDILALARFNRNVPWDSEKIVDLRSEGGGTSEADHGAVSKTHLFLFDDPGAGMLPSGKTGNVLGLEADVAEFRIYFRFNQGAYVAQDVRNQSVSSYEDERVLPLWWKRTPWFQGISVYNGYRTKSLYRAPLR